MHHDYSYIIEPFPKIGGASGRGRTGKEREKYVRLWEIPEIVMVVFLVSVDSLPLKLHAMWPLCREALMERNVPLPQQYPSEIYFPDSQQKQSSS
ncbi:unnamed protein product [Prunus armeniaca]|uniref:Uncharacterized protein n=1 Tax=Prunus armeniaca TaxID=36596 RepID=A0A6J5YB02_PRUAR|nr:unnamed protein product [Prunus armeniaca]